MYHPPFRDKDNNLMSTEKLTLQPVHSIKKTKIRVYKYPLNHLGKMVHNFFSPSIHTLIYRDKEYDTKMLCFEKKIERSITKSYLR